MLFLIESSHSSILPGYAKSVRADNAPAWQIHTIAATMILSQCVGCDAAGKVVQYNIFFTVSEKLHLKSHLINDYILEK